MEFSISTFKIVRQLDNGDKGKILISPQLDYTAKIMQDAYCTVATYTGMHDHEGHAFFYLALLVLLFRRGHYPKLRNRGLHDVGHVGAATGRGAKPRQAFLKVAA